jgi:predicted PurR-regulated permease PerM
VIIALLKGPWIALVVLLGYLTINTGIGNFLEPLVLGRRFGVSTLVIIISVFFWGWMWGPMGMFLAVPLTMVVKVVFDNSDDFRWLSVAMGKGDVDEERILAEQRAADERRRARLLED